MSDPEIVPRGYWIDAPRGGSAIRTAGVDGIAYHWPASIGQRFGVESKADVARRLRGWRNYHVNYKGWSDIGYNLGVDMAGRGWDLRGLWRVGAHCASSANPNANWRYIGILLIMGTEDRPTDAMINAFQYLRTEVVYDAHGSDANDLLGHRQVYGAQTECPGDYQIQIKGQLDNTYKSGDWLDMASLDDLTKAIRNGSLSREQVERAVHDGTLSALKEFHDEYRVQVGSDLEPMGLVAGRSRSNLKDIDTNTKRMVEIMESESVSDENQ